MGYRKWYNRWSFKPEWLGGLFDKEGFSQLSCCGKHERAKREKNSEGGESFQKKNQQDFIEGCKFNLC